MPFSPARTATSPVGNRLPESDVQTAQGFKLTRLLLTILDVIEAGLAKATSYARL
jgi:hypothetical protein